MSGPEQAGEQSSQPSGRIAGIDFGTVRIGIALSDPGQRLASPHATYTRQGEAGDARYFRQLAAQEQVSRFVVGLPVHISGDESAKSQQARRFGAWLAGVTGLPVDLYDERLTTVQAEAMLEAAGLSSRKRKLRRDKLAAQVLLAAYLESAERGAAPPGALEDGPRG